jgi:mRNA interferase HicA
MKRSRVLKHLRRNGCRFIREGGSHSWWGNPSNHRRSAVPRHSEISDSLVRKICKDLGIPFVR